MNDLSYVYICSFIVSYSEVWLFQGLGNGKEWKHTAAILSQKDFIGKD